jgi:hypothetical protein
VLNHLLSGPTPSTTIVGRDASEGLVQAVCQQRKGEHSKEQNQQLPSGTALGLRGLELPCRSACRLDNQ